MRFSLGFFVYFSFKKGPKENWRIRRAIEKWGREPLCKDSAESKRQGGADKSKEGGSEDNDQSDETIKDSASKWEVYFYHDDNSVFIFYFKS